MRIKETEDKNRDYDWYLKRADRVLKLAIIFWGIAAVAWGVVLVVELIKYFM